VVCSIYRWELFPQFPRFHARLLPLLLGIVQNDVFHPFIHVDVGISALLFLEVCEGEDFRLYVGGLGV